TTGGVAASLALLGDVNLAEPGALIGFAGPRVVEQTIQQRLPAGLQRAESLRERDMVDLLVPRPALRATLARLLALLAGPTVVRLVAELRADLAAAGIALTHFEFATLLACEWFRQIGVDVGVIEVGLGGRLDATNLVRPIVSCITSIGHDHEAYLGHDLAAIAGEKAGILKPRVPLALGPTSPEAEAVIRRRAAEVNVAVTRVGVDARLEESSGGLRFYGPGVVWEGLRLGLRGGFQRDNASVALTALALVGDRLPCGSEAVRQGL